MTPVDALIGKSLPSYLRRMSRSQREAVIDRVEARRGGKVKARYLGGRVLAHEDGRMGGGLKAMAWRRDSRKMLGIMAGRKNRAKGGIFDRGRWPDRMINLKDEQLRNSALGDRLIAAGKLRKSASPIEALIEKVQRAITFFSDNDTDDLWRRGRIGDKFLDPKYSRPSKRQRDIGRYLVSRSQAFGHGQPRGKRLIHGGGAPGKGRASRKTSRSILARLMAAGPTGSFRAMSRRAR